MIKNPNPQSISKKGSYGLALVFAVVTIIGAILMYSSPPGVADRQKETNSVQTAEKVTTQDETFDSNYSGYVLRTVLVTLFIIILIIAIAKIYRNRVHQEVNNRIEMHVLGRKYIGPKQFLLMVNVERRNLLLGVTDNSINLIASYEPEEDENVTSGSGNENAEPFAKLFKRFTKS